MILASLLALALLASCRTQRAPSAPEAMPSTDSGLQGTPVGDERTAMEAAIDTGGAPPPPAAAPPAGEAAAAGPVIAPNAPDSYTVKHGDTLWGIAKLFLRDPWYWPEIWQVNPQVQNPHRIYPGDTLRLVYVNGQPRILLQPGLERGNGARVTPRVRSAELEAAITTIPYEKVAAFMSKPAVLTKEQIKNAPYVLATRDAHIVMADDDTVYARGFTGQVDIGVHYNFMRVGEALRDPDDNHIIGYHGIYTGSGHVTRSGDPTSLLMTESVRETYPGDKLFPGGVDVPLDFVPSAPRSKVKGRIIAVQGGTVVIGQYEVVAINRGTRDGLAAGNVLAVLSSPDKVIDNAKGGFVSAHAVSNLFAPSVRLPSERTGTFMVFKAYDQVSFGLIMEATDIIHLEDYVGNP
jgi:hypothetical protein